jgi:hypothetical protein
MKGNERVDRLADLVVVHGVIAMDRAYIPNIFRDNLRVSDAANNSEPTTMNRLNELTYQGSKCLSATIRWETEKNCEPA